MHMIRFRQLKNNKRMNIICMYIYILYIYIHISSGIRKAPYGDYSQQLRDVTRPSASCLSGSSSSRGDSSCVCPPNDSCNAIVVRRSAHWFPSLYMCRTSTSQFCCRRRLIGFSKCQCPYLFTPSFIRSTTFLLPISNITFLTLSF